MDPPNIGPRANFFSPPLFGTNVCFFHQSFFSSPNRPGKKWVPSPPNLTLIKGTPFSRGGNPGPIPMKKGPRGDPVGRKPVPKKIPGCRVFPRLKGPNSFQKGNPSLSKVSRGKPNPNPFPSWPRPPKGPFLFQSRKMGLPANLSKKKWAALVLGKGTPGEMGGNKFPRP